MFNTYRVLFAQEVVLCYDALLMRAFREIIHRFIDLLFRRKSVLARFDLSIGGVFYKPRYSLFSELITTLSLSVLMSKERTSFVRVSECDLIIGLSLVCVCVCVCVCVFVTSRARRLSRWRIERPFLGVWKICPRNRTMVVASNRG